MLPFSASCRSLISKAFTPDNILGRHSRQAFRRPHFLIDPDGLVRKSYLSVNAEKHSAEVLADLAQFQLAAASR
jgi:peroxiredoxin